MRAPQAPPVAPMPTAPQAREPTSDMTYLLHTFEPTPPWTLSAWDTGSIRRARDEHLRGEFTRSAQLAEKMLVDGKIYSALGRRIGPALGIPRDVTPPKRWNGKGASEVIRSEVQALFAETSTSASPSALTGGVVTEVVMGTAIFQNAWTVPGNGARIIPELRPWPMSTVTWNDGINRYQAQTLGDGLVTIEPNDGKWIVLEPWGPRSFRFGAIQPLALLWSDRAYSQRDRSNHSAAHGSISIIGTMPEGMEPSSPEGLEFRKVLRLLQQARSGLVKPHGALVEPFEPRTLAWQIFQQIVNSAGGDMDLVLCGIGSDSGVYKSIPQIDGVRYDLAKMDVMSLCYGLHAGFVKPYVIYNHGPDPDLVPGLRGLIPDPRQQARLQALAEQHDAFTRVLANYRKAGLRVDQVLVDRLAEEFSVTTAALAKVDDSGAAIEPDPIPQISTAGGRPEVAEQHAEDDTE